MREREMLPYKSHTVKAVQGDVIFCFIYATRVLKTITPTKGESFSGRAGDPFGRTRSIISPANVRKVHNRAHLHSELPVKR